MRMFSTLLWITACRPGQVARPDKAGALDTSPDSPGDSSADSPGEAGGDTGETADSSGSGETGAGDSDSVSEEQVQGTPASEGVCQVALTCDGAIVDSPAVRCDMTVDDSSGTREYEGPAGVELRGRSSMDFPKKQFAVELWDDAGEDVEAGLLDMGSESDWVLNGAWVDRSLFRNKMAYDLFQQMGDTLVDDVEYGPESRFCELTLNGDYWGVYLLSERPKRDGSRIEISDAGETDGSSFVLKLEESGGAFPNPLGYGTWRAVYPRQETASAEALAGVEATLNDWFSAARARDGAPELFSVIDLDSAVDFVLIEELAKNVDAYFLSIHLWKDTGGLVHFTPWDLDLSCGQPSYSDNENPESWVSYRPAFIDAFSEDPTFKARLAERWVELRSGPLDTETLHALVDQHQATLAEAAPRNFERWPIEDVDFSGYLYRVRSWDQEVDNMHDWLDARLPWMDANIDTW